MSAEISRIVLGTDWMIAVPNSARWNLLPTKRADTILEVAVELGINTFDTARIYASEGVVGRFLRASPSQRDKLAVISKGGHPAWLRKVPLTRERLMAELSKSLKALATEYIDLYLVHYDDPRVPARAMADWGRELLRSGRVLKIGYSNIRLERLKEIQNELAVDGVVPWVSNEYSVFERSGQRWVGAQNISRSQAYVDHLVSTEVPFLAYSPLGRGSAKKARDCVAGGDDSAAVARSMLLESLAEKYRVSIPVIALSFVLQTGQNFRAIVGTSSPDHLRQNMKALALRLSQEDYLALRWPLAA